MNKVINAFKKYGLLGCFLKFLKKVLYRVFRFFDRLDNRYSLYKETKYKRKFRKDYDYLEKLCKSKKYKYVFIFYPYTEWNLPVFQRPQQIALSMSKRNDILYLYCTTNYVYDKIDKLYSKINDNLYVVTDYEFLRKLDISNKVLHLYSTDIVSHYSVVKDALANNEKVLYEYIDEIHEDITNSMPDYYLEKHKRILKNENCYVVVTADKLLDDALKYRKSKIALSTNGVNVSDFIIRGKEIDSRIKDIKANYKKIICYYGSLATWFDYDLIKKCANKHKDYAFVLMGIKYDDSFDKSKIERVKNVFYLGKVPYSELINITKDVDLLTIPFVINEITESTSPVKLFEYMATQKPILTTDMKECRKYQSVLIGKNHEDFIKKIDEAISLNGNKDYHKLELKEAKENTWDSKATVIIDLLDGKK